MSNLFIVSETIPNFTVIGKHWVKSSTGQIYIYQNNDWQPFAGGDPYAIIFKVPLTIFINGIDRSGNIDIETFRKKDVLTSKVDTCSFTLFDYDNLILPSIGEEVIIYYKPTELATPEKIFGGVISNKPQVETAPGQLRFEYKIKCVDYSKGLKRKLAVQSYENKTPDYIIKDLIDTYFSGEYTYVNVQEGIEIAFISFNYKSVGDAIKELADLIDYDWYVDYDKDIHFFDKETNNAPYSLTETVLTGHYKDLMIEIDKAQLRNKIFVRGGKFLSNIYTQERVADGTQQSFNIDYEPRGDIKAYVDSGAGYVEKTVGIDNINDTGFDFVINFQEKVLKNLDLPTLSSGHKLKITYQYEVQVLTEDTDDNSIKIMKEIEGGTGIYESLITDSTIQSLDTAHARAIADLDRYANPIVKGSFKTDQDGYRSGQSLLINMPTWNYPNSNFMIQSVSSQLRGDNTFWYKIDFATYLKDLTDFLVDLVDKGKEIIVRQNETLHELAVLVTETIKVLETTPTFEEFTPPYKYGPGGSPQGIYNESQYS